MDAFIIKIANDKRYSDEFVGMVLRDHLSKNPIPTEDICVCVHDEKMDDWFTSCGMPHEADERPKTGDVCETCGLEMYVGSKNLHVIIPTPFRT